MHFFVYWLVSIFFSFAVDLSVMFRMYKDAADAGYKVDNDKLSELSKEMDPNESKIGLLILFTPFINVAHSFKGIIDYNESRYFVVDLLRMFGVLERMSNTEIEEYQKKTTGFHAFITPIKCEIMSSNNNKEELKKDVCPNQVPSNDVDTAKEETEDTDSKISNIREQRESLEKLKDELLSMSKEEKAEERTQSEKGPSLVKKREK